MLSLQLQQFPVFWGQHYLLLAGSRGGAPTAAPASCDSKLGIKTEESGAAPHPGRGPVSPERTGSPVTLAAGVGASAESSVNSLC